MKKVFLSCVFFVSCTTVLFAQKSVTKPQVTAGVRSEVSRPKLVVGLVVDQMRWDYFYRYYSRYGNGGFKRLLNGGFKCENTFINYIPSYTAIGHSSIYTGSVPALHGIAGNNWIEQYSGAKMYCTQDDAVNSVGTTSDAGKMSPKNLLATTITDELRLATNFKSKTVSIALKDRSSILPGGHTGEAYWLDDKTGNFITSTFYSDKLPAWVEAFNKQKRVEALVENGWNTLYDIKTYTQSSADDVAWEGRLPGKNNSSFPHDLKAAYAAKKTNFRNSPFGTTITFEMAEAALKAYNLGNNGVTDFLTISCSSPDNVGHFYGPNSIEIEDVYLRLDRDLEAFFNGLDAKVGKNNWLFFISADHGAAHAVGFNQANNIPSGLWNTKGLEKELNSYLEAKYKLPELVTDIDNFQVTFNMNRLDSAQVDFSELKKYTIQLLKRKPEITFAVDVDELGNAPIPAEIKEKIANGYNTKRSGSINIVLNPAWFEAYASTGTTHGTWNPYDTHIPLVFYGWNVKPGQTTRQVHMTDIAPTLAAMLHIQMPNACIGKVITEVADK